MNPTAHSDSNISFIDTFYPLAVGNEWSYVIEGNTDDAGETITFSVLGITEGNGSREIALIRSTHYDFEPLILVASAEGLREDGTERYLLTPNLHRGVSLTGNFGGGSTTLKLVDVDKTIKVGDHTFEGCLVTAEACESLGIEEQITYAPGVGPIRYSGGMSTLSITSWKVQEAL